MLSNAGRTFGSSPITFFETNAFISFIDAFISIADPFIPAKERGFSTADTIISASDTSLVATEMSFPVAERTLGAVPTGVFLLNPAAIAAARSRNSRRSEDIGAPENGPRRRDEHYMASLEIRSQRQNHCRFEAGPFDYLEKIDGNRIQEQEMNTMKMYTYVNFSGKCAE